MDAKASPLAALFGAQAPAGGESLSSDFADILDAQAAPEPGEDVGDIQASAPQAPLADVVAPVMTMISNVQQTLDGLSKQMAMTSFLKKMDAELGVKPEQVVEAFAQLSPQDLAKAPEENIPALVAQLPLDGKQKDQASEYFSDLLKVTEAPAADADSEPLTTEEQTQLAQIQAAMALAPAAPAIHPAAPQLEKQAEAKAKVETKTKTEVAKPIATKAEVPSQAKVETKEFGKMDLAKTSTPAAPAKTPKASAPLQDAASRGSLQPSEAPTPTPKMVKAVADSGMAIPKEMLSNAETEPEAEAPAAPMNAEALGALLQKHAIGTAPNAEASTQDKDTTDDQPESGIPESMTADAAPAEFAGIHEASRDKVNVSAAPPTGNAPPATAAPSRNVQDLISQAQIMIKKGGGEMKIQLQPEGLGQIAMHVKVNDGKVMIDMVAQNNDAKKLIEKGLGDLKASLTSHALDVSSVKVNLAKDISQQFDQQRDQQQQRQLAQQFLEDFRQAPRQPRPDMYETSRVANGYSRGPLDVMASKLAASQSQARRLDLVA